MLGVLVLVGCLSGWLAATAMSYTPCYGTIANPEACAPIPNWISGTRIGALVGGFAAALLLSFAAAISYRSRRLREALQA